MKTRRFPISIEALALIVTIIGCTVGGTWAVASIFKEAGDRAAKAEERISVVENSMIEMKTTLNEVRLDVKALLHDNNLESPAVGMRKVTILTNVVAFVP